ncbi:hypothetical protein Val02_90480 [Virgisporangium aliadipatigenens]|uniref:Uncharacterized protein n=1 Tax=Virgisporangium aliadipatigenens TaxID=741659 RepID=A0A8J3YX59_9ACTN|nr:DUF2298 domain-containing protein [Virgisporangium aliadipatigenens]GIJ52162.1 hypothetical protein Val02_90480 [Virgisporangium aliadipatigenens]
MSTALVDAPTTGGPAVAGARSPLRWAPLAVTLLFTAGALIATGTPVLDILKYALYTLGAVLVPGTLVYRAVRPTVHSLVDDLAMGIAVGLVLEIAGWAVFVGLGVPGLLWLWPLAVVVPFVAVPRLRRHWWVRGYTPVPIGWAWVVAAAAVFFVGYLALAFLRVNPILPAGEDDRQYLDLAYQLSLAGEAAHRFPPDLPQVSGEPLTYHWFGHMHMAVVGLIGHIDLTVVSLRLAVPGLSLASVLLTAVIGWRVSGKPYAGAAAAVLMWVIGEVSFSNPLTQPFGTQVRFAVWHGMSLTYSWVFLLALIGVVAVLLERARATGLYVLAFLFMLASTGAKASSLPVALAALGMVWLALLVAKRRIPWPVTVLIALGLAAQLIATAVLFRFRTYGLALDPLSNLAVFWDGPADRPLWKHLLIVGGVVLGFLVNMQIRGLAAGPLLTRKPREWEPVVWFLLGGALAGPALYLAFSTVNAQYFARAGFTFLVLAAGWGYAIALENARLTRRALVALASGSALLALALLAAQVRFASPDQGTHPYSPVLPILKWSAGLALIGALGAGAWFVGRRFAPALRGRGVLVALTFVMLAGAHHLPMDVYQTLKAPQGGPYFTAPLPRSRVDAARWVRAHSDPGDIVATNAHCLYPPAAGQDVSNCDARVFWLSGYAGRSVLVEGWGFAPRPTGPYGEFWDLERLRANDAAFLSPTADGLRDLRTRYKVRYLVVDRRSGTESPTLASLADKRYDNGQLAVYEIRR